MKIGEVAHHAGVAIDTLRFYERRGVLPPPPRRPSGYRVYSQATIERVRFVKQLQELGLTLDEVRAVLRDVDAATVDCKSGVKRFEAVLQRIDDKLAALRATRRRLTDTLARCQAGTCTLADRARRIRA
jgi:DNA-binding transcriptional MerR regulator